MQFVPATRGATLARGLLLAKVSADRAGPQFIDEFIEVAYEANRAQQLSLLMDLYPWTGASRRELFTTKAGGAFLIYKVWLALS